MKYYLVFLLFILCCKDKPASVNLELKQGSLIACGPPDKEYGTVSLANSCSSSTQKDFNLGVAMLHSFEYDESEKAFARVLEMDSTCAMAYWGVAMSNFHQVWPSPPTPAELEKGSMAIQKARELATQPGTSRDYINTIAAYYQDYSKYSQRERILHYAKAMDDMYKKYPDDKEITIFYALSLVSAADPSDKSYADQKKAGKILEALYPGQPMHPGIVHYIIHAYDSPELASMALDAARKYASIAPASAHAQHMPSHIFTRLGLWDEAAASNIHAAESAKCYAESAGIKGHWDEELHAIDYLMYAYLQEGDNRKAKSTLDYLTGFTEVEPVNFKVLFTFAASPSRYYLENGLWKEASALAFQPGFPWERFPWQKAIVHFTRSLGASRVGKPADARVEWGRMQPCYDSLTAQRDEYKANQVKIQMTIAHAWILFAEGKKAEGLKEMQVAAEMEDRTEKSPVTPGEVLPARQLLGDMLMEEEKYSEALTAYEADLKKHPNRFNSLANAGSASGKIRDRAKEKMYYEKLVAVAPLSDRKEVVEAKAFLNTRP